MSNLDNYFILFTYLAAFNALLCIGCVAELIYFKFFNKGE